MIHKYIPWFHRLLAIQIFFANTSASADKSVLYTVPLLMNHGVDRKTFYAANLGTILGNMEHMKDPIISRKCTKRLLNELYGTSQDLSHFNLPVVWCVTYFDFLSFLSHLEYNSFENVSNEPTSLWQTPIKLLNMVSVIKFCHKKLVPWNHSYLKFALVRFRKYGPGLASCKVARFSEHFIHHRLKCSVHHLTFHERLKDLSLSIHIPWINERVWFVNWFSVYFAIKYQKSLENISNYEFLMKNISQC